MPTTRALAAALVAGTVSVLGPVVASDASDRTGSGVTRERMARQSVVLTMHPQIAHPGTAVAAAAAAKSAMTATIKPRKKGRPVLLQRKQGRRWVTVGKTRQKSSRVELTGAYKRNGRYVTYRVVAARYRGLKQVRSKGMSTKVADAEGFVDDFDGTALDATAWAIRADDYQPLSKRKCSKGSPDATSVSGGAAHLSVLSDPERPRVEGDSTTTCPYQGEAYDWRLNGHIGTQDSYDFRYGYAAARIKFQPRQGQHGAFWLMPASRVTDEGSATDTGAEIDVIEWFGTSGRGGGNLSNFIHYWPDDGKDGVTARKVGGTLDDPTRFGADWSSKYHVFSVEWTPKAYTFRIDGRQSSRITEGVSAQPEYLILSLLSSDYELPRLGGEQYLPQTMSVDWVRTWER